MEIRSRNENVMRLRSMVQMNPKASKVKRLGMLALFLYIFLTLTPTPDTTSTKPICTADHYDV